MRRILCSTWLWMWQMAVVLPLLVCAGCDDDVRTELMTGLKSGTGSILTAVIGAMFTALSPDTSS